MLYYLFKYLDEAYNLPGAGVIEYSTFRSGSAIIVSLLTTILFGKKFISYLQKKQIIEPLRKLELKGENTKANTPTMGGLIIILGILIPTFLFAKLDNIYIILLIFSTIWLGIIGFTDDYIKVIKNDKKGLKGKIKVMGQVILGLIIGLNMYFHPDITLRINNKDNTEVTFVESANTKAKTTKVKSLKTNVPFFKENEFDYSKIFTSKYAKILNSILFIFVCIFIITAVSNGANLTDGLDGLCTGTASAVIITLGIFAFVSGNYIIAEYLNVLSIPQIGEVEVFAAAFTGACVGFLWYNVYPAQIFMGDTGSLTIGGLIAVMAIMLRKELLIPILCGIYVVENLSVIIQVYYFKYTRKVYGTGKRLFLMSPLHHHFQKKGIHESIIVTRFWIVGIILAVVSIITLKLR